jgi:hypothetical protein
MLAVKQVNNLERETNKSLNLFLDKTTRIMTINPFANILRPYFNWLSETFENLANETVRNNLNPDEIAREFLSDNRLKENFNRYMLPELESFILNFWAQNNTAILSEIAKLPGLKARFGGDIGPQYRHRVFERLGVYYDSLLIPDPLLRCIRMNTPLKRTDFYTLKYCITHVLNKDAYLADVYPPIAILFGENYWLRETSHYPTLIKQSSIDAIAVANAVFAQKFDTEEDVKAFFQKLKTPQALAQEVARTDLLLFDEDLPNDPVQQLEGLEKALRIELEEKEVSSRLEGNQQVWMILVGRMMQANELLQESIELDAHPVTQAPISFHWLTTKVKINSELLERELGGSFISQLPITNALLSRNLNWISNVPLDSLIRLRKQGFLNDLRTTIAGNMSELSKANIENLERVSQQVDFNLQIALSRHQEQIQTLNQTLISELAISVPTLLFSIAGVIQPLFGNMLPSWVAYLATIGGTTSLKDVVSSAAKHIRERQQLGKSPIGILWHARENFIDEFKEYKN